MNALFMVELSLHLKVNGFGLTSSFSVITDV
jgi:hypothetical protein